MFSPEYYSKLDPSYRQVLAKLESELEDTKSNQAQNAIMDFMGKYMVTQELFDLVSGKSRFISDFCRNLWMDSMFYLYFFKKGRTAENKNYDGMVGCHYLKDLIIPNKYLNRGMEAYEKQSDSFIPTKIRQRHEEMKALYLKIKTAESDIDEWFAALLESDDHQFVKENVEYRLGNNMTDKKLWKRYIDYLWDNDFKHLLETYSKCVRFFTDDEEIMNGYRQAANQYGRHIPVPWKNPCSIEVHDDNFWNKKTEEFRQQRTVHPVKPPLTIHFNAVNPAKPDFPFLLPTIRYILENASGEVLQKLFKTCKWFRVAKPVNVCYKFEDYCYAPFGINEQSITSSKNSILRSNLSRIFISTVFSYNRYDDESLLIDSISNLMPMIYRCTAKYIDITHQNLSWKELQFLIGDAVDLCLENVRDFDGNDFKLEDILQATPKIKSFRLGPVTYTSETTQKLYKLKFENKIEQIDIGDKKGIKTDLLDPEKFAEFVKKNCSSTSRINIGFKSVNEEYDDRFHQVLGDAIKEKWIGDEKPDLYFYLLNV